MQWCVEDLNLSAPIGEGMFGIVYKAMLDVQAVAVKALKCQTLTKEVATQFRNEVDVMRCVLWFVCLCWRTPPCSK